MTAADLAAWSLLHMDIRLSLLTQSQIDTPKFFMFFKMHNRRWYLTTDGQVEARVPGWLDASSLATELCAL